MTERRRRYGILVVCAVALAGCDDLFQEPDTGISQRITLLTVSGDHQTGAPGEALPEPLRVRLEDLEQGPTDRLAIEWTVLEGSGSVEPRISFTDEEGIAETTWILGPGAGRQRVIARFAGDEQTFEAQVAP